MPRDAMTEIERDAAVMPPDTLAGLIAGYRDIAAIYDDLGDHTERARILERIRALEYGGSLRALHEVPA